MAKRLEGQNAFTDLLFDRAPASGPGTPLLYLDGVEECTGVPDTPLANLDGRWMPANVTHPLQPAHTVGRLDQGWNPDGEFERRFDSYHVGSSAREDAGRAPFDGSGWVGFAYDLGPLTGEDPVPPWDVLFEPWFNTAPADSGHMLGYLVGLGCTGSAWDPNGVYLWIGNTPTWAPAFGGQHSVADNAVPGWTGKARLITPNGDTVLGGVPGGGVPRLYWSRRGLSVEFAQPDSGDYQELTRVNAPAAAGTWMQVWRFAAASVQSAWETYYETELADRHPMDYWHGFALREEPVETIDPWAPTGIAKRRWVQRDDALRWDGPNGPRSAQRSIRWGGGHGYA